MLLFHPKLITNVETEDPVAALTFDDGPHPVYTPYLLKILEKHQAKATFFMVGEAAQQYPEIVRSVYQAGHIIGNHSWDHPNLKKIKSRWKRLRQLWACARATAPYCHRLFRPPFGAHNAQVGFDALLFQYKVILWSKSVQDWVPQDPEEIARKMIDRITPGTILLLHDAIYANGEITDEVKDRTSMLEGLDKGLSLLKNTVQFLTVPELLMKGHPVCRWPIPSDAYD